MRLAETDYDNSETGCCAPLDVARWDGRELVWNEQPFLRTHVRELFHVPINFGAAMAQAHKTVEASEAYPQEPFWLTEERSPWGAEVYVALDRELPDTDVERISGRFRARAFEGPYRNVGAWIQTAHAEIEAGGGSPGRTFVYYATCPKCAKRFGRNDVVVVTQMA